MQVSLCSLSTNVCRTKERHCCHDRRLQAEQAANSSLQVPELPLGSGGCLAYCAGTYGLSVLNTNLRVAIINAEHAMLPHCCCCCYISTDYDFLVFVMLDGK